MVRFQIYLFYWSLQRVLRIGIFQILITRLNDQNFSLGFMIPIPTAVAPRSCKAHISINLTLILPPNNPITLIASFAITQKCNTFFFCCCQQPHFYAFYPTNLFSTALFFFVPVVAGWTNSLSLAPYYRKTLCFSIIIDFQL